MRPGAIATVCALFVMGLAGCLSGAGGGTPTTSSSLLAKAEDVARAKLPEMEMADGHDHAHGEAAEADLVAVVSLEVSDTPRFDTSGDDWFLGFLEAGDLDDGLAASWGFVYRQGDHDAMAHMIVVDASGRAMDPVALPEGFPLDVSGPALPATWAVGAEQAVPVAAAGNPEWATLVNGDSSYLFSYLVSHTDKRGPWGPTWIFEAGTLDGPGHLVAAVDAVNATYRPLGVVDPFSPVITEQDTVSGTLTAASPNAEHTLAIQAPGHKKMKFFIDVPSGANNFDVVATGPDGQEFGFWWDTGNRQARWQTWDVSDGDWNLALSLTAGESQAYMIHWCAVGATHCAGM